MTQASPHPLLMLSALEEGDFLDSDETKKVLRCCNRGVYEISEKAFIKFKMINAFYNQDCYVLNLTVTP